MEYMDGGNRFERIVNNAFWANAHLDTKLQLDRTDIDDNYKQIQDCINHPTIGLLAEKKCRTSNYPLHYAKNQISLLQDSSIKAANDVFCTKFDLLYPKTGNARRFLIENDSIVLNYVKPIKKNLRRMLFRIFNI